jgi:hypothetical protein
MLLVSIATSMAGDAADGPNRYEADFAHGLTPYQMSKADQQWVVSLLRNLKEPSKAIYFTRTDLLLRKDGTDVQGLIYRRIDQPQYFYIAEGDVMLDLKNGWIYNPGVGGFSMHSPKPRNFIVCLNFQKGGVPFIRHSQIKQGNVWWFATEKWKRLEDWQ